MTLETAEYFEERFTALIEALETAQHDLQAGRVPNLKPIETEVTSLCKQVEDAPFETAQQVQPVMVEMIGKLDMLAQTLMEFKQQAAGH